MTQGNPRDPQSRKIEHARDLQAKLYREIGISAVAAALRFTTKPDGTVMAASVDAAGVARRGGLAA